MLLWLFRCDFEKFFKKIGALFFCGNLVDFRFLDIKSKVFETFSKIGRNLGNNVNYILSWVFEPEIFANIRVITSFNIQMLHRCRCSLHHKHPSCSVMSNVQLLLQSKCSIILRYKVKVLLGPRTIPSCADLGLTSRALKTTLAKKCVGQAGYIQTSGE